MHTTTITANLTHDPDELRHVGDAAVLNLNVAVNRREKVRGEWQDGEPTFYRLNLWRDLAINASDSLRKGQEVIVVGTVKTRTWEKDGQKRSSQEIDVEAIGPNLRFQTTTAQKAPKNGGGQRAQSNGFAQAEQPAQDPWVQTASGGTWGEETPF